MIRRLRIKMVVAAILSLLLVLLVIIGTASVLNYTSIIQNANETLLMLKENDGSFPEFFFRPEKLEKDNKAMRRLSLELPYESRYFFASISQGGEVSSVNTGKIAAIDTSQAIVYAEEIYAAGKTEGFLNNYRYMMYADGTETKVIFLDCRRELDSFRSFLLASMSVALLGLLMVLLLLIVVSGRVVKPFAESYEKQKRFITDAGHELKTPLTIIDADAEVLRMDIGENEWLDDIKVQTGRLAELTASLIYLARMEEEKTSKQIEFSFSDIVLETAESFQALAKTTNRTLDAQVTRGITVKGDEKALQRLLTIFLDNAMKYSNEGGTISVSVEKKRGNALLTVFNTADSVPRENLPQLFDRFYRMDSSRNSATGGYGLGLSIAAAIVKTHKGKISATTEDEKSLKISVSLPCREG